MARYSIVKRHRDYYKYGTELNATVVGNFAKIEKGVASGFSASQYLVHPVAFTPNTQTWERVFKYTTGSTVTDGTIYSNGTVDKCGDSLFIYGNKPRLLVGYTASAWNIDSTASYTLSPNTSYWFKISFTGTSYNVDVSTNDTDYENIISVASSTVITANMSQLNIGQRLGYSSPLTIGYIDLSQSYININGERWWSGDSYTKVGSWIEDGVVSGFSSANYLTLPFTQADLASADNWEVVTCFTTSTSSATCFSGATGTYLADFGRVHNNKFGLAYSSNGSSYNISGADPLAGTYAVTPNTKYWVRQKFTGTEYTLEYSLDGETYVKDISITSSVKLESTKDTVCCGYSSARSTSHSSIDLTKSYIKINDKDWWHGTKAVESTEADADYHVDSNKLYSLTGIKRDYYKYVTEAFDFVRTGTRSNSGWQSVSQGSNYLYGTANAYEKGQNAGTSLVWTYQNTIPASTYTFNIKTSGQGNGYFHNPTVTVTYADSTTEVVYTKSWSGVTLNEDFTFVASKPIKAIKVTGTLSHSSIANVVINLTLTSLTHIAGQATTEEDADYYTDRNVPYNFVYNTYEVISETFNVSNELQTYVVPEGVSKVNVVCVASRGTGNAGNGGSVKCDLAVTEGQMLYVMVGGIPTVNNTAVYNASDIRIGGTEYENRIIVAGGGGTGVGAKGGAGGGLTGGNAVGVGYQAGAFGGTQTAGGGASYRSGGNTDGWLGGAAGTLGMGGNGGYGSMYGGTVRGGAGGAGYYGGGGGGVYDINKVGITHAGGGGGSSYTDESLCSNVLHLQGNNNGEGFIKISYIKEIYK